MKLRRSPFISILICFLFIVGMNLIGEFCLFPFIFKDAFNLASEAAQSGSIPDFNAMTNQLLDTIYPKLLEWNYVLSLVQDVIFIEIVLIVCKFNPLKLSENANVSPFDKKKIPALAVIGMAMTLVMTIIISVIMSFSQSYADAGEQFGALMESATKGGIWLEIFFTVIIAPMTEELLCRGLMFRTLKKSFSSKWVIVISALFFALLHGNIYQGVYTFIIGLLLGYIAESTGSVIPAMIVHAFYNGAGYILDIPDFIGIPENTPLYNFLEVAILLLFAILVPIAIILFRSKISKIDLNKTEYVIPKMPDPPFAGQNAPFGNVGRTPYPFENTENGENEMAVDFIVAGLGNVGEKYASNRHNTGFLAIDYIGLRERFSTPREKFRALTYEKVINGKKVLFLKPQTMMNLSGEAIGEAARFYKIPAENVLVIYDDINFDAGDMRIRPNGSAGGHNGIKSIISHLGTEEFPRIKVGVGKLPPERDLVDWVLSDPPESDMNKIISNMESVYDAMKLIVDGKLPEAQQKYN